MKELEVIDRLRKAFPGCGIGDDAAVLSGPEGDLLFATDAAAEGVHFNRKLCTLSQAVQKLVTSNVSDIFAMGGAPGSVVFTAGLPEGCTPADVDSIIDGLRRSSTQYGVKLVGGDTVLSPGGFFFNVAIVGEARPGRAVLRSGARAGDAIVLFGEIGFSGAGLGILSALEEKMRGADAPGFPVPGLLEAARGLRKIFPRLSLATSRSEISRMAEKLPGLPDAEAVLRAVQQHVVPLTRPLEPSLLEAEPPVVRAMIDVSDGLAKDLRTLCEESGAGAVIREQALPVPPAVGTLSGLEGSSLIDFAISSGEEYVLLAAVSPEAAGRLGAGAEVIGSIAPASGGIVLVDPKGKKRSMPKLGYEHVF
jgi:thiamine-monophosphate kinase